MSTILSHVNESELTIEIAAKEPPHVALFRAFSALNLDCLSYLGRWPGLLHFAPLALIGYEIHHRGSLRSSLWNSTRPELSRVGVFRNAALKAKSKALI